ncbi:hypothetical protein WP39_19495 [Streptomyces sp. 604F]|nr:hypothetical protein [Streptomyces sp. 604F]
MVNGLIGGALGIAVGLGAAYAITAAGPTLTARLGSLGGGMGGGSMGRGPGGGGSGAGAQSLGAALTAPVSATTLALAVGLAVAGGLVAVGDAVTRFSVGDRVGVGCMVDSCRTCEFCLAGREQNCVNGSTGTYNATGRDAPPGGSSQTPTAPSSPSRKRSAWPLWRA